MRCLLLLAFLVSPLNAGEKKAWTDLLVKNLDAFKTPTTGWEEVGAVQLDAKNPRRFDAKAGTGIFYNGPKGNAKNLFTKEKFGDLEVHLEFNLPKGANSGIKFHGHYEIQIADSFGKKKVDGSDCGGIYPRALLKPKYHHIDTGIAPLVNACAEPGTWQTLEATFTAPRFDKDGKKTKNARLRALLNGKVIHDDIELLTPTGDRWQDKEMTEGPIMLQADHGPVAFRNIRVRKP